MNRQRIAEIISNPGMLNAASDMPLVKELIAGFPYFPIPYVLLTKLLHDENSIYFDKNLKLGAAYIGNRELLYHYINNKPVQPEEIQSNDIPEIQIEAIPSEVAAPGPVREESVPVIPETSPAEVSPVEASVPDYIDEDLEEPLHIPGSEPVPSVPDIAEPIPAEVEVPVRPKEFLSYAAYDYFAQYHKKAADELKQANVQPLQKENAEDQMAVPHSFTEWFDVLEARGKSKKEAAPAESPKKKEEVISLIDKFIQAEPRIRPQQTKMYKPEDMAKLSAKEDLSIATETMANIFMKQGLKQKAIEIFQQLILRYPQKSGYFADKIREIESESL
jgi:tetratricopeptide (TPR) repeat protein